MSKDQLSAKVGSRGQFMVSNAEGGLLSPVPSCEIQDERSIIYSWIF